MLAHYATLEITFCMGKPNINGPTLYKIIVAIATDLAQEAANNPSLGPRMGTPNLSNLYLKSE